MAESKIQTNKQVSYRTYDASGKSIDLPAGGVYYGTIVDNIVVAGCIPVSVVICGWGTSPHLIVPYISDGRRVGAMSAQSMTTGTLTVLVTYIGGGTA